MVKTQFATADKLLKRLKSEISEGFNTVALASFDRLNVIRAKATIEVFFHQVLTHSRRMYLTLMKRQYEDSVSELLEMGFNPKTTDIDMDYVLEWLDGYNPITRYRYETELERKRLRYIEEVATARELRDRNGLIESSRNAKRLLDGQVSQYTTDAVHDAHMQALKDAGVHRVRWITMADEKVCGVCDGRDGEIYPIDAIPQRHYNCRCWVEAVR